MGIGRALAAYHRRAISAPRIERVAAALSRLIALAGGADTLLDVGSGDGAIARRVGEALGAETSGVDVLLQPDACIGVACYDGRRLPHGDGSVDVVLLSDVLHHADDPTALLGECLRVARRGVALKDHLCFGAVSSALLLWMDRAGNAGSGVAVPGRYLSLEQWFEAAHAAGGRITALRWPLEIHDLPWRVVTRSELQFAAFIEPAGSRVSASRGGKRQ
jgi:SAM-dependent methyltransferase